MKIYHKDANLVISKIINYNIDDIKKLSQTDRKICMQAVECLSSKEDKGINVNLPNQLSFDRAINHIKNTLDSKTNPKKFFFLIQLIISAVKWILNFLHLRISSIQLCKNIESIKKSFLTNNWDQYLKDYCDVTANCDLNMAKIVFIGDQHADYIQNIIRRNLISHYANEDQAGENLVLLEGLDTHDFPLNLEDKKFVVESWENEEHCKEHEKVIETHCKLLQEFKLELNNLEKLKTNNDNPLKDKKKSAIKLVTKIKEIDTEIKANKIESDKLKKSRDEDLIAKVKFSSLKKNQKIFVIAGSNHLVEKDYKIIDFFNDLPCAVIIPKESDSGKKNADKVVQNIINLGTYDAAYENL